MFWNTYSVVLFRCSIPLFYFKFFFLSNRFVPHTAPWGVKMGHLLLEFKNSLGDLKFTWKSFLRVFGWICGKNKKNEKKSKKIFWQGGPYVNRGFFMIFTKMLKRFESVHSPEAATICKWSTKVVATNVSVRFLWILGFFGCSGVILGSKRVKNGHFSKYFF